MVPSPPPGLKSSYRKVQARRSWDFAIAGAALALQFDGNLVKQARVVLSAAAPVPWRSKEVEEVLINKSINQETVAKASEAVMRNARPLEKNAYKIPLFRGIIEEELIAIG
jgi:xanthine dehydrogenase YagS FAD-binding subunit